MKLLVPLAIAMPTEHPLLTGWKNERRDVVRRLARDPSLLWYWRIRLRVLEYLISRYSGPAAFRLPHVESLTLPRISRHRWSDYSASVNVRDSARIRTLLTRIHTNVHPTDRSRSVSEFNH
jgi:hypothetical protein